MAEQWIKVSDQLPEQKQIVETKIDANGVSRNEAKLKLIGRLWWHSDGSMYVYYTPTHWKPLK